MNVEEAYHFSVVVASGLAKAAVQEADGAHEKAMCSLIAAVCILGYADGRPQEDVAVWAADAIRRFPLSLAKDGQERIR